MRVDKNGNEISLFSIYNVVVYDGSDAFVHKFILKNDDIKSAKKEIETVYSTKVLLLDKLYDVSFDNIVGMKDIEDNELRLSYRRFISMYF